PDSPSHPPDDPPMPRRLLALALLFAAVVLASPSAGQPPAGKEKAAPKSVREAQAAYDQALRDYLNVTEKYARHPDTVQRPAVPRPHQPGTPPLPRRADQQPLLRVRHALARLRQLPVDRDSARGREDGEAAPRRRRPRHRRPVVGRHLRVHGGLGEAGPVPQGL